MTIIGTAMTAACATMAKAELSKRGGGESAVWVGESLGQRKTIWKRRELKRTLSLLFRERRGDPQMWWKRFQIWRGGVTPMKAMRGPAKMARTKSIG